MEGEEPDRQGRDHRQAGGPHRQAEGEAQEPAGREQEVEVEDPLAAPPEVEPIEFDAKDQTSELEAPSIGMALDGREKGMKKALLAAYGGTATTEGAVVRGLLWVWHG